MDVRGPQVNVERSDLTLMVETAESARIKLYKQLEVIEYFQICTVCLKIGFNKILVKF